MASQPNNLNITEYMRELNFISYFFPEQLSRNDSCGEHREGADAIW